MVTEHHVLLVDGPVETEAVLRAVLQPRGVAISRIRSGGDVVVDPPSVVVLHDEPATAEWPGVPRVLIGRASDHGEESCCAIDGVFQYADLVATIDRLLTRAA